MRGSQGDPCRWQIITQKLAFFRGGSAGRIHHHSSPEFQGILRIDRIFLHRALFIDVADIFFARGISSKPDLLRNDHHASRRHLRRFRDGFSKSLAISAEHRDTGRSPDS